MPIVKVWNDNIYDFKQSLKGEDFTVPAKGFIEMEYEEAIDFKGAFSGMPPQDFAGDERLYHKMIRVDAPPPNSVYRDEALTNHLTGQKAASPEDLAKMLAAVRHLAIQDPEAEKSSRQDASSELADLKAQVERLTQAMSKLTQPPRGPGRPRKEA